MTTDPLSDVRITDSAEFKAVLARTVEKAVEENVDVRGAWEFETQGSTHGWEVEILELIRDPGREANETDE